MSITLQNLKTHGYIDSKTKSYQILREFLLLFIFHAFLDFQGRFLYFRNQQAFLLIIFLRPSLSGLCPRVDGIPIIS